LGSSGTNPAFNTQLISNNVEVSGSATIDINFNDDENFEKPPCMDLLKLSIIFFSLIMPWSVRPDRSGLIIFS